MSADLELPLRMALISTAESLASMSKYIPNQQCDVRGFVMSCSSLPLIIALATDLTDWGLVFTKGRVFLLPEGKPIRLKDFFSKSIGTGLDESEWPKNEFDKPARDNAKIANKTDFAIASTRLWISGPSPAQPAERLDSYYECPH